MRRRVVGVGALVVVLLSGCTAGGAGDRPAASAPASTTAAPAPAGGGARAPLEPADGAYLGVFYGDRDAAATDAAIGRAPQVHLTYVGWRDPWATDPGVVQDLRDGRVPLVNWEPDGVDLAAVVAGRDDALLAARAREAAALPGPVLLDLAAEMNEEAAWGGHDPALYVAFYRHVHDVMAPLAGGRLAWVWAVNNVDSEGTPAALDYYPGDAYVDWTGVDGYNWGDSQPGLAWQSPEEVLGPSYDLLAPLGKPVIVAETASAEEGGSKADWVRALLPALRERMPRVRAVVWFDVDKERDWRIGSSPGAEAAFLDVAADPYLQARRP